MRALTPAPFNQRGVGFTLLVAAIVAMALGVYMDFVLPW